MPEMDGYTASQLIRNDLKISTPIIAMTAYALKGEREKCLSFGMNEYISKPIREELLQKMILQFTTDNDAEIGKEIKSSEEKAYKYINLKYLKEVSTGNIDFEKTVTEQFIEIIPTDLKLLEEAWKNADLHVLKQVAHNMNTSISVMGLNRILEPYLYQLEYGELTELGFTTNYNFLKKICETAVEEAIIFYSSLPANQSNI